MIVLQILGIILLFVAVVVIKGEMKKATSKTLNGGKSNGRNSKRG